MFPLPDFSPSEASCGLRVRQAFGHNGRDRLTGVEHLVRCQTPDIDGARDVMHSLRVIE
jgi:hypothetical protein